MENMKTPGQRKEFLNRMTDRFLAQNDPEYNQRYGERGSNS